MAKEVDVMNLSFIDLLSCGLGGILLLLLLFAAMIRTNLSRGLEAERAAGGSQAANLASGDQLPPPEPLSVRAIWTPEARYPLRLLAYPPKPAQETLTTFAGPGRPVLTEERGVVRAEGDRYHGLFARYPLAGRRSVIDLLVPRSRSATFDLQLLELSGQEPETQARRKAMARVRHADYWQFEVVYPDALDEKQEALRLQLRARWGEAQALKMRVLRVSHPAGADARPREFGESSSEIDGPTLGELLTRGAPADAVTEGAARAAGAQGSPGGWTRAGRVPVAVFPVGGRPVSAWLKGWEEGWGDEEARRRTEELGRLWSDRVWPGLLRLAAAGDEANLFHRRALELHAEVEKALDRPGRGARPQPGALPPPTWQSDLNAGRIPGAFTDGERTLAAFFTTLQEYADRFVGTAPDVPGAGQVTVRLEVRSQAHGSHHFRAGGKASATLAPRGVALFENPPP